MRIPDTLTKTGAHDLAHRIKMYWRQRGIDVETWAASMPSGIKGELIWVVRSKGIPVNGGAVS